MPPKRQFRTDLLPQLAVYRFGNFSQEDWKRVRQTADGHRLPVYRNELASLEQELIERFGERAQEMTHLRGAYLDLFELVQRVLAAYIEVNRIYIPKDRPLRLKITHDGRSILGEPNVALMMSFSDVPLPHLSQAHVHTFAIFDGKETPDNLAHAFREINLDRAIRQLSEATFEISGVSVTLEVFLILDWMSAVPSLGFRKPNTMLMYGAVCGWCSVDKWQLKRGWLKEPWRHYPIEDDKSPKLIPSLDIMHCRYDPMHGCKCILDTVVHCIFPISDNQARFTEIMREACKTKKISADMKEFFSRNLVDRLANTFSYVANVYAKTPTGEIVTSRQRLVQSALNAIQAYKQFSYSRSPLNNDASALDTAREALLTFFAAFQWQLTPTTHYMTNHFIDFAKIDEEAFWSLQEGAEHGNRDDKVSITTTFGRGRAGARQRTGFQQMLEQQEVRRILVRQGYGEHPYALPPLEAPRASDPITPVHLLRA